MALFSIVAVSLFVVILIVTAYKLEKDENKE
jgi:hypothetical protein